jgi:putative glycosyltransferase
MRLSIVTTLYRSASTLPEFYARIKQEVQKITDDYETIFVNDGSPDNSLEIAISLYQRDPCVKIIDLSRNFGHHKALMTGLAHAEGDLVFLIDSDLEEPPELLGQFYDILQSNTIDVVFGVQDTRKGAFFERQSGTMFYTLFNLLSDQKITPNQLVARLMTRRYVAGLLAHQESELMIAGLWYATGFAQIPVAVRKHSKPGSTYNLARKVSLAVRSITSFSSKPLVYIAYLGAIILGISGLVLLYLLSVFLFFGKPPEGYTSLIASMWFLGGLIIFSVGVVAIYLSVIFVETKRRPYTIIRRIYERGEHETTLS